MNAITAVNTNLDIVTRKMELLKEAVAAYNFINPVTQPPADGHLPPPDQNSLLTLQPMAENRNLNQRTPFFLIRRGKLFLMLIR